MVQDGILAWGKVGSKHLPSPGLLCEAEGPLKDCRPL